VASVHNIRVGAPESNSSESKGLVRASRSLARDCEEMYPVLRCGIASRLSAYQGRSMGMAEGCIWAAKLCTTRDPVRQSALLRIASNGARTAARNNARSYFKPRQTQFGAKRRIFRVAGSPEPANSSRAFTASGIYTLMLGTHGPGLVLWKIHPTGNEAGEDMTQPSRRAGY
jgi:hypothetical protein